MRQHTKWKWKCIAVAELSINNAVKSLCQLEKAIVKDNWMFKVAYYELKSKCHDKFVVLLIDE